MIHVYYVRTHNNVVYICISVLYPAQDRIYFSPFSKVHFSKRLKQFCSMLLLYTAIMIDTSKIPHFFCSGMIVTGVLQI